MKPKPVTCEVNLHDLVALLEVQRSQPGHWERDPENALNEKRNLVLNGRVLRVFQGGAPHHDSETFAITVVQRQPRSGRIAEDYGPWSRIEPETGQQLLVFGHRPTSQIPLNSSLEQGTQLVLSLPDPTYPFALEDVQRAVELKQRAHFPAALAETEVQTQIFQARNASGPILARFLVDAAHSGTGGGVEPLLYRLVEAGDAAPAFRAELLRHLVEAVTTDDETPKESRTRLARAMVTILEEPGAANSPPKDSIRQAYLRNVLFTASGEPRLSAPETFPTTERERLRKLFAGGSSESELTHLMTDWLGQ